jgi:hypothetical protein
MHGVIRLILLTLVWFTSSCFAQRQFPEWKVSPVGLSGVWQMAPLIVVGEVANVASVGSQKVSNPPWPASPDLRRIYWCEADFQSYSVLRGHLPPSGEKLLWGASTPGCSFKYLTDGQPWGDEPVTRVWFLREEGRYLRPVVDAGGLFFCTFHAKRQDGPHSEAQFGELLLTPSANSRSLSQFAVEGFYSAASVACLILGQPLCTERLKSLAGLGDPKLSQAACSFLSSQFDEPCSP